MAKLVKHMNNEHISDSTYETINTKFEEVSELYIAENNLSERQAEEYLDSFTFEEKVLQIIKAQEIDIACSRTTIRHLNNR